MDFKGVEILTEALHLPDYHGKVARHHHLRPEWPRERIDEVGEQLDRLGLQAVCISISSDFLQPSRGSVQGDVDEVCANVDLASRLRAPLVRAFATNRLPDGMDRDTAIGTIAAALRLCGRHAASRGVRIAVENHGEWPAIAQNIVDVIRATDSPSVGLTAHVPHVFPTTPAELIREAPGKIWHLHLSDDKPRHWSRARPLYRLGYAREQIAAELAIPIEEVPAEGVAVGEGGADIPGIIRALRATGYSGWFNHEGSPERYPEPTEIRSYAYLRRILAE